MLLSSDVFCQSIKLYNILLQEMCNTQLPFSNIEVIYIRPSQLSNAALTTRYIRIFFDNHCFQNSSKLNALNYDFRAILAINDV